MKYFSQFKAFFSAAAALTLLFAGVASAQTAPIAYPIERPALKVGDTWTWQRTDLWKGEVNPNKIKSTVESINAQGNYRVEMLGVNGTSTRATWDADLNGVKYKFQGEDMYQAWYKWPLNSDTSWDFAYKLAPTSGGVMTLSFTCKVNKLERVKVPAGEFDAVKLTCEGPWANGERSGTNEAVTWYAPAVKTFVKLQNKFWGAGGTLLVQSLDELMEFSLK
jgi:hypothetical protein